MDVAVAFHRSFLDVTHFSRLESGWSEYRRVALPGSTGALLLIGSQYGNIEVFPKPLQDFDRYATGWERTFSPLCKGVNNSEMTPIVGAMASLGHPVIGYYGNVQAQIVIVPKANKPNWKGFKDYIAQGGQAYVGYMSDRISDGWDTVTRGNVERLTVITNPEGEVLMAVGRTLSDDSIQSADIGMFIGIGSVVAALSIGAGKRLITAVMRRQAAAKAERQLMRSLWEATRRNPQVVQSPRMVTSKEIMEWEMQGGHTIARHDAMLTKAHLRERITGETTVPPPGTKITKEWRVFEGKVNEQRLIPASAWTDAPTMHRAIGEIINQNLSAIRQAIATSGEWSAVRVQMNYVTGKGWRINRAGAANNVRRTGPAQLYWDERLTGMTIHIRRGANAAAGADNWYVVTAFPEGM